MVPNWTIERLRLALVVAAAAAPQSAANLLEHLPWNGDLGHLKGDIAAVADDRCADLDQFLLQARQRPVFYRLGGRQRCHPRLIISRAFRHLLSGT